jgi:hypothetical protein
MRVWFAAVGSLILATAALAQSTAPKPTDPPASDSTTTVAMNKRFACRSASQNFSGQDRIDQMQLCMAQARLDCIKQAIDQRTVSPQRKDFLATCGGTIV